MVAGLASWYFDLKVTNSFREDDDDVLPQDLGGGANENGSFIVVVGEEREQSCRRNR